MSPTFWLLFAAALLTLISKVPMNLLAARQQRYDNHHPRLQQLGYQGAAHRAWAAHQNTLEAFPLFAVGVLITHEAGIAENVIWLLGNGFLFCRVLYIALYLADWDRLRSLVWGIGFLLSLSLYLTPLI